MLYPNGRLIIFAKAPTAGKVKTRLIPTLTAEQAAGLSQQLIKNTLSKFTAQQLLPVELWCAPDSHHSFFNDCAQQFPVVLKNQTGSDLGARMENAITATLKHSKWAIIIGTDCPELDDNDLEHAMLALENGNDAVIQPANDGGYVLIGLKQCEPDLFRGIDWGTSQVFSQTRQKLNDLGWSWKQLESRQDIDRPEDLKHLNIAIS